MNEKKNKRSHILTKKSPTKKRKRQAKKAPKKIVKESLKQKQKEYDDECSASDKNEESSAKMMDIGEDTNSDKKS